MLLDLIPKCILRTTQCIGFIIAITLSVLFFLIVTLWPVLWFWQNFALIYSVPIIILWFVIFSCLSGVICVVSFNYLAIAVPQYLRDCGAFRLALLVKSPKGYSQLNPELAAEAMLKLSPAKIIPMLRNMEITQAGQIFIAIKRRSEKSFYDLLQSHDNILAFLQNMEIAQTWQILSVIQHSSEKIFYDLLQKVDQEKTKDMLYLENLTRRRQIATRLGIDLGELTDKDDIRPYDKDVYYREPCHIEELRDMLEKLKADSHNFYQYGHLGRSIALFNGLSMKNRRWLIYWAMTQGDKDVQNVAIQLMQRISPTVNSLKDIVQQMSSEERVELKNICKQLARDKVLNELSDKDKRIIIDALLVACARMKPLEIEEAYWVLLNVDQDTDPVWVEAMGKMKLPDQVSYKPTKEERYELITLMRESAWVLHVHNHPISNQLEVLCEASMADCQFARYWKFVRPELANKMMFFVVQGDKAIEYTESSTNEKTWIPVGETREDVNLYINGESRSLQDRTGKDTDFADTQQKEPQLYQDSIETSEINRRDTIEEKESLESRVDQGHAVTSQPSSTNDEQTEIKAQPVQFGRLEKCINCDRVIGRLEKSYMFNGNVVCWECFHRLESQK